MKIGKKKCLPYLGPLKWLKDENCQVWTTLFGFETYYEVKENMNNILFFNKL